eukprot:366112-Chlamydomonas_euryale.AAC.16
MVRSRSKDDVILEGHFLKKKREDKSSLMVRCMGRLNWCRLGPQRACPAARWNVLRGPATQFELKSLFVNLPADKQIPEAILSSHGGHSGICQGGCGPGAAQRRRCILPHSVFAVRKTLAEGQARGRQTPLTRGGGRWSMRRRGGCSKARGPPWYLPGGEQWQWNSFARLLILKSESAEVAEQWEMALQRANMEEVHKEEQAFVKATAPKVGHAHRPFEQSRSCKRGR